MTPRRQATSDPSDAVHGDRQHPRPGSQTGSERLLRAHAAVLAAAVPAEGQSDPLAALQLLGEVRSGLDETERCLIEAARQTGASWARIAAALGLGSRQAAEQRWLRLSADSGRDPARSRTLRERQRSVDNRYGATVAGLRATVLAVHRELSAAPGWDELHPLARLARTTLGFARDAEGGALFALATQAVADLDAVPADRLPGWSATTLESLRRAVRDAAPTRAGEPTHS
ncbi:hypothetical protein [Plantactinospora sonchi]|uniref:Uncharacterized protein n=1 Tax=Plantactinospora sonchi TaxID=1544735 RepID=A0ABU7RZW0_9ACTN